LIQDKIILLLLTKLAHARRKPFVVPSGAGAALITDTIPPANVIGIIQINASRIAFKCLCVENLVAIGINFSSRKAVKFPII
jgi:hypothetical protein